LIVGGAVGMIAGTTFALYLESSPAAFVFGAVLGLATGMIVGALLSVSTADLPDAPVPPVRATRPAPPEASPDISGRDSMH
jgi:hypothetical protein